MSPSDSNVVVVTGPNIYRYFRIQDSYTMKTVYSQVSKKELSISMNFTCHAWMPDSRLLICNDNGDILILEGTGEYKYLL
jgi:hypothetical protein